MFGLYAPIIKTDFMISRNHNFMPKFELIKDFTKLEEVFLFTIVCEISSMDKDISLVHFCYFMKNASVFMGIRDSQYS